MKKSKVASKQFKAARKTAQKAEQEYNKYIFVFLIVLLSVLLSVMWCWYANHITVIASHGIVIML